MAKTGKVLKNSPRQLDTLSSIEEGSSLPDEGEDGKFGMNDVKQMQKDIKESVTYIEGERETLESYISKEKKSTESNLDSFEALDVATLDEAQLKQHLEGMEKDKQAMECGIALYKAQKDETKADECSQLVARIDDASAKLTNKTSTEDDPALTEMANVGYIQPQLQAIKWGIVKPAAPAGPPYNPEDVTAFMAKTGKVLKNSPRQLDTLSSIEEGSSLPDEGEDGKFGMNDVKQMQKDIKESVTYIEGERETLESYISKEKKSTESNLDSFEALDVATLDEAQLKQHLEGMEKDKQAMECGIALYKAQKDETKADECSQLVARIDDASAKLTNSAESEATAEVTTPEVAEEEKPVEPEAEPIKAAEEGKPPEPEEPVEDASPEPEAPAEEESEPTTDEPVSAEESPAPAEDTDAAVEEEPQEPATDDKETEPEEEETAAEEPTVTGEEPKIKEDEPVSEEKGAAATEETKPAVEEKEVAPKETAEE